MPDSPVLTEEQQKAWEHFKSIYVAGGTIVAAPDVYRALQAAAAAEGLHLNERVSFYRAILPGTMIAMRDAPTLPSYQITWDSSDGPSLYVPLSSDIPIEAWKSQAYLVSGV